MANHISFHPIYIIRSGYTDAASRLHSDCHQGTRRRKPTVACPSPQRRVWAPVGEFGPLPWLFLQGDVWSWLLNQLSKAVGRVLPAGGGGTKMCPPCLPLSTVSLSIEMSFASLCLKLETLTHVGNGGTSFWFQGLFLGGFILLTWR